MRVHFDHFEGPGAGERRTEIVERKGKGHPDTICDLAMEEVSVALCRAYRERCGRILHHNCDKALLAAGAVERRLGGGSVVEPMRLVLGDRAASAPGFEAKDVAEVAVDAVKGWFRSHLPHVDPDRHLTYQVELRAGSAELVGVFREDRRKMLRANDTSAAVGYAPLTETERIVLETERFLNGNEFKSRYASTGEDVKVMGVRTQDRTDITVAMPFLDSGIASEAEYFRAKEEVCSVLKDHLTPELGKLQSLGITLNALDRSGSGLDGMYLSVLGTSAEDADSGEVGRGNRVNGLIPLSRPGSTEAAAGKNPVSHVGKIYNVLSHILARRIHREVPGIREVTVWLCSRIGDPVDAPHTVAVGTRLERGCSMGDIERPVTELIARELGRLPAFVDELAEGQHPVC
jgi:S-adenosylmethionine synthetase